MVAPTASALPDPPGPPPGRKLSGVGCRHPFHKEEVDAGRGGEYGFRDMSGRLRTEIKQNKPFGSPEVEAFLNIQRTAGALGRGLAEVLKPAGLSEPQYNILRILRGTGTAGCACREIGERMVTRDPDITRLLDRLESAGLVARAREQKDRRVVTTRITEKGLELLKSLDAPIVEIHRKLLGHLGERRLHSLIELLEAAREKTR